MKSRVNVTVRVSVRIESHGWDVIVNYVVQAHSFFVKWLKRSYYEILNLLN